MTEFEEMSGIIDNTNKVILCRLRAEDISKQNDNLMLIQNLIRSHISNYIKNNKDKTLTSREQDQILRIEANILPLFIDNPEDTSEQKWWLVGGIPIPKNKLLSENELVVVYYKGDWILANILVNCLKVFLGTDGFYDPNFLKILYLLKKFLKIFKVKKSDYFLNFIRHYIQICNMPNDIIKLENPFK